MAGLCVAGALALVAGAFALPVADVIWRSVTEPVRGIGNYRDLLTDDVTIRILVRTANVALKVTVITVLLAYPYAYAMSIAKRRTRAILIALVLLPLWMSLLARTFAWVVLLQDEGPLNNLLGVFGIEPLHLIGTQTAVTIGMAQVLLPFMVLPVYTNLRTIDRRLLLAAQSLGATPRTAFWRVYFPQSLPGVRAGATLVFLLAMGFYVTPALLGSPQDSLAAQLVASKVAVVQFPPAGALSVLILVTAAIGFVVISAILKLGEKLLIGGRP